MEGLQNDENNGAEDPGEEGESEQQEGSGSYSPTGEATGRDRFWRSTARLGFSLGLSPKELWTEYTYNELIARLHFYRERRDEEIYLSKVSAFHNLVAMSYLHGEGKKGFNDIFPARPLAPPTKKCTTEELKAEFEKHKIRMG